MSSNKQIYDVIVVGGGAAGLFAVLNLDSNLKVLMLTKRELTLSNSSLAQGGIAAVYDKRNDTVQEHFDDTLVAGGFKNDKHHVDILVNQGPDDVQKLIDCGVDFDKNPDGYPNLTLEGGHGKSRILHHQDCTGKEIVDKLLIKVKALQNVTIMKDHVVCDLQKTTDQAGTNTFHLDVLDENNQHIYFATHFVVLCTGGIGRVYEYTTNSSIATGDGIALAHKLGAEIKNLNLIQFHPTGFANKQTRETFLISESVRGEGAHLINCNHERFMQRYDDRLELAPRDVVSRCIMEEAKKTGSNDFYLDITYKDKKFVKNRFPMIYANLMLEGYDMTRDLIPVYPCQHYLMGGINVDDNAKTNIEGLYACGECSHTGVHGNNRLASNSLLEAVVFSHRCADEINSLFPKTTSNYTDYEFPIDKNTALIRHGIRTEIRSIMQKAHFVTPDKEETKKGYIRICELIRQIDDGNYMVNRDLVEAKSLATIASIVLSSSVGE